MKASAELISERNERERLEQLAWDTRWMMTRERIIATSTYAFGFREGKALKAANIPTIAELSEVVKNPDWYRNINGIGQTSARRIEFAIEQYWDNCLDETNPQYNDIMKARKESSDKHLDGG